MDWSRLLVRLFLVDAPDFLAPGCNVERTARNDDAHRTDFPGAEHDLIREVHPKVHEIKEHMVNVAEAVSPQNSAAKDASS